MENVDISKWVRSALVIDDKWDEVKNLLNTLNSNGVSTCYYNPNPEKAHDFDDFLDYEWLKSLEPKAQEVATQAAEQAYKKAVEELSFARMQDMPADSLLAHNLIFLDIDYKLDAAPEFKDQVNYAVGLLKNALSSTSSPYGIILWSKESETPYEGEDGQAESSFDYIKNFFYGESFEGKPRPLFVVDIEKDAWEEDNFDKLIDSINQKLHADKMAKFFACWNDEVLKSTASAYQGIHHHAESLAKETKDSLETEFFNLLKHATYTHFGFSGKQEDGLVDTLSRYSFCYMSSELHDILRSRFSQKDIAGVFDDSKNDIPQRLLNFGAQAKDHHGKLCSLLRKNEVELDDEVAKALKGAVATAVSKDNESATHSVLARLNFNALYDTVRSDIGELPGLIYLTEFKHTAPVTVNITPPCDIAQGRSDALIYLSGTIRIYKTYTRALKSYKAQEGERCYKTSPALFDDGSFVIFCFDLRSIQRKVEDSDAKAQYLLKDSIFTDLMQKFGHHNSRLGARTY